MEDPEKLLEKSLLSDPSIVREALERALV